jgi:hypothetical protein
MSTSWHTAVTPLVRERSTVQSYPAAPPKPPIYKASRGFGRAPIVLKVHYGQGSRRFVNGACPCPARAIEERRPARKQLVGSIWRRPVA